jgi:hydroxypyruvate isomerase
MDAQNPTPGDPSESTRREWLGGAAGAAALGMAAIGTAEPAHALEPGPSGPTARNGRIKQSLVEWCYAPYWDVPAMIKVAKDLGCTSIELLDPKYFPLLKEAGLHCAIGSIDMAPDAPFVKGFNNPKYREQVLAATRKAIDICSEYKIERVITFTGMSEGIPDDVGAANCVEGYKQIIGHAEKKGVTLCL